MLTRFLGEIGRICGDGIRAIRKWVLIPKPDTQQSLKQELQRILDRVAVGDWEGLPVADLDTSPARPWWESALNITCSLATIAILPVIAYVWTNEKSTWIPSTWRIAPELKIWIAPITVIWVIVGVLTMIDPHFGDKLANVKTILDIARGSGDKKG